MSLGGLKIGALGLAGPAGHWKVLDYRAGGRPCQFGVLVVAEAKPQGTKVPRYQGI